MSHPVFGDALLQKKDGGKLSSVEALSSKKFVLLYFSAHWCPPCRKFTPKLVEWYNEYSEAQNFECVFVSGDETQESFDDYYKDMPWLALPFENRDLETELSAKFGIKGIPTLLVLGPDGEVITDKGRAGVELKPAEIPWAPILKKSSSVLDALRLFGDLTRADGSTLSVESLVGKPFALYFSASWCPPVRAPPHSPFCCF
jgi:nucleoredoxin